MFHLRYLISIITVSLLEASTLANPITQRTSKKASAVHGCSVFIQRWYDNTFDVYVYNSIHTPACGPFTEGCTQVAWVETAVSAASGSTLPDSGPIGVASTVGSYPLVIVYVFPLSEFLDIVFQDKADIHFRDTANPANPDDGGKLNFSWGNKTWDSYSPGNPCAVQPQTDAGALQGYPTTYACSFSCDV